MEPDDPRREWLPRRIGPRPRTTPDDPHKQLTQIAPIPLQDELVERVTRLPGTFVCPSLISLPGARGFALDDTSPLPVTDAFLIQREFAHIHPPYDGSLHMIIPPELVLQVMDRGWGEQHPVAKMGLIPSTTMMVYGPRDTSELEVVWQLLKICWSRARGDREAADGPTPD